MWINTFTRSQADFEEGHWRQYIRVAWPSLSYQKSIKISYILKIIIEIEESKRNYVFESMGKKLVNQSVNEWILWFPEEVGCGSLYWWRVEQSVIDQIYGLLALKAKWKPFEFRGFFSVAFLLRIQIHASACIVTIRWKL